MPLHRLEFGFLHIDVWTLFGRLPVALLFAWLLFAGWRRGWHWRAALLTTAALGAGLSLGTALLPSVLGALGGGIGAWLLAQRLLELRRPPLAALAVGLTLVVAVGRLGCLCSGCCFGMPSTLPWAVHYAQGSAPWLLHRALGLVSASATTSLGVHPYPLYESLALLLWLPIIALLMRRLRSEGAVLALTAAYDLAVRAGIDGSRAMVNVWWAKLSVFAGLDRLQWALALGALGALATAALLERHARATTHETDPAHALPAPSVLATWGVFAAAWLIGVVFQDAQTPFLYRVHLLSLLAAAPALRVPQLGLVLAAPRIARQLVGPALAVMLVSVLAGYAETTRASADEPGANGSTRDPRGWLYEIDHRRGLLVRLGSARDSHASLRMRHLALQLDPIPDAPADLGPVPDAPTDLGPVPDAPTDLGPLPEPPTDTGAIPGGPTDSELALDTERVPDAPLEPAHDGAQHWLGIEGVGGHTAYTVSSDSCGGPYTAYDRRFYEGALRYEAQLAVGDNWTASVGGRAGLNHTRATIRRVDEGGETVTRQSDWFGFANAWAEIEEPHLSIGLALYGDEVSAETSVDGLAPSVDERLRVRVGGHMRAGFSIIALDVGYLDRDALLGVSTLRFGFTGMLANGARSIRRIEDARIRYGAGVSSYPSSREWLEAQWGWYFLAEYLPTTRLAVGVQGAYVSGGGAFGVSLRYRVGD